MQRDLSYQEDSKMQDASEPLKIPNQRKEKLRDNEAVEENQMIDLIVR